MRNKRWIGVLMMTCFFSLSTLADVTVTLYLTTPDKSNAKNTKIRKESKAENTLTDIGTITFKNTVYGVMMTPDLHGLPPGMHGLHLHGVASCKHKAKSAGDHYDPNHTGKHLGPYTSEGHLGDLPALYVDQKGVANHPILAPQLNESDLNGHAVIIHAGDDNYSDLPVALGGGGDRIACGVIKNNAVNKQ